MIRSFLIGLAAAPFVVAAVVAACIIGAIVISIVAIGELGEAVERRLWK